MKDSGCPNTCYPCVRSKHYAGRLYRPNFTFILRVKSLGIPILFLTSGTHEDYHQVTDELINLDTDKVSRVARLMFHMAMAVAQITERPEWNEESYRTIVAGGGQ